MRTDGSFVVLRAGNGRARWCSSAEPLHGLGVVAVASGGALGGDLVDALEIRAREGHVNGAHVLLEILATFGAGDGNHVVALRENPRERELRGRASLLGGESLDVAHQLEVLLEVGTLKAR